MPRRTSGARRSDSLKSATFAEILREAQFCTQESDRTVNNAYAARRFRAGEILKPRWTAVSVQARRADALDTISSLPSKLKSANPP